MTIPEAAQLVMQAGAMRSNGGNSLSPPKNGEVYVLEMGEPVKIMTLAQRMIRLSGLTERTAQNPQGDITIEITGIRPGEKLYEELLIADNPRPTQHPRIFKADEPSLNFSNMQQMLKEVHALTAINTTSITDTDQLKQALKQYVAGYSPTQLDTSSLSGSPSV